MTVHGSNLTARDRAILDTLTRRVRVLSMDQVARTWYAKTVRPIQNAVKRLRSLEVAGLVEQFSMPARPELVLGGPLLTWHPGGKRPDWERLSYRLTARWNKPAVPTPLIIATRSAGTWLGGFGGRRPRRSEVSHDLSFAGVYLHWLRCNPSQRDDWISEARLRHLGFGDQARLPDALVQRDGRRTVIELGGAYSADKLREFHGFCADRGLPYELW